MNLKPLFLLLALICALHSRTLADDLRESYVARLSARDHFSSKGERLDSAAAVIRQDRANFHLYNLRDDEDEPDSYFASKANRERLEKLLDQGSANKNAVNRIVNGTPLIKVMVYVDGAGRDYITVKVISD